jgi:hypothetical protein
MNYNGKTILHDFLLEYKMIPNVSRLLAEKDYMQIVNINKHRIHNELEKEFLKVQDKMYTTGGTIICVIGEGTDFHYTYKSWI